MTFFDLRVFIRAFCPCLLLEHIDVEVDEVEEVLGGVPDVVGPRGSVDNDIWRTNPSDRKAHPGQTYNKKSSWFNFKLSQQVII